MMSNPYESAFGEEKDPPSDKPTERQPIDFSGLPPQDESLTEALDELLEKCQAFTTAASSFVELLSNTRAVDHRVPVVVRNDWLKYLVQVNDPHEQGSLKKERRYYQSLENKFRAIMTPMKVLARQHLDILKQFFTDIDEHYFSPNKSELEIQREIGQIQDDLILQRQILHDAQDALSILAEALAAAEKRMQEYVNAGGENNISASELVLMSRKRQQLTKGEEHAFNYSFFELNLLDRASLLFGKVHKETTAQYMQQLSLALEVRDSN